MTNMMPIVPHKLRRNDDNHQDDGAMTNMRNDDTMMLIVSHAAQPASLKQAIVLTD